MVCPKCNTDDLVVKDTRTTSDNHIRRRRVCRQCGYRFTTYEITQLQKAIYDQYYVQLQLTKMKGQQK